MDEGFLYSPMPNPRGGFTTRPVLGKQITEADFDAAVSADTGLPPEQCADVLTHYLRYMLTAVEDSQWSPSLYGLIGLYPTSGGSKPGPEDFHTAADINAGVRIAFSAEAIRQWQQRLGLVSRGLVGKVTPVVTSIISLMNDRANEYTPMHFIEIRGRHLKLDTTDPQQGVFFILPDGTEVRSRLYAGITRLRVIPQVPETLSGPLGVRVASWINGSVRSFLYPVILHQVATIVPA